MVLGTDSEFTFWVRTEGENLVDFYPISDTERRLVINYSFCDKFGNIGYGLEFDTGNVPDVFSIADIASYYETHKITIHRDARQLIFNQTTEF